MLETSGMGKWGKILNALILETGISKNSLHDEKKINRHTLNNSIRSAKSPTVASLDKYLRAFKLTWDDWALGCKLYEQGRPIKIPRLPGPQKKKARAPTEKVVKQGA